MVPFSNVLNVKGPEKNYLIKIFEFIQNSEGKTVNKVNFCILKFWKVEENHLKYFQIKDFILNIFGEKI